MESQQDILSTTEITVNIAEKLKGLNGAPKQIV